MPKKGRPRFRSAETGQYVSPEYAEAHPESTVSERAYLKMQSEKIQLKSSKEAVENAVQKPPTKARRG